MHLGREIRTIGVMSDRRVIYQSGHPEQPDVPEHEERQEPVPMYEQRTPFTQQASATNPQLEQLMQSVGLEGRVPQPEMNMREAQPPALKSPVFRPRRFTGRLPKFILGISGVLVLLVVAFSFLTRGQAQTIINQLPIPDAIKPELPSTQNGATGESASLLGSLFNSDDLIRDKTTGKTKDTYYVRIQGETSRLGLGNSGRIQSGFAYSADAVNVPDIENIPKSAQASRSLFLLESWDVAGTVLAAIPVKVDGNEPYTATGAFANYLLLPWGTNSIVLKERDGKILDQVYAPDIEPYAVLPSIPSRTDVGTPLDMALTLEEPDIPVVADFYLINEISQTEILLKDTIPFQDKAIKQRINFSRDQLKRTNRWKIRVTLRWMFGSKHYYTDEFLIQV